DEKTVSLTTSIGLQLKDDGSVTDVIPGKAADKAGIGPGMRVLGVNDRRFGAERMREAVPAPRGGRAKLVMLLESHEYFKTVTLDYRDGEKYPALERVTGKPDLLSDILGPRK